MRERSDKQNYSNYIKAISATILTIGTFLFAKSTGYLFGISESINENTNNLKEQNSLNLRRSIDQAINQSVNQQTSQSLHLINATAAGKCNIPNLQDMIIKNNIAYIAAGVNGF